MVNGESTRRNFRKTHNDRGHDGPVDEPVRNWGFIHLPAPSSRYEAVGDSGRRTENALMTGGAPKIKASQLLGQEVNSHLVSSKFIRHMTHATMKTKGIPETHRGKKVFRLSVRQTQNILNTHSWQSGWNRWRKVVSHDSCCA